MLSQVLIATLRILTFRAGPQDFPFAPALSSWIVTASLIVNYLLFSQIVPVAMAFAWAAAVVGGLALVTHSLLRARGLTNRMPQTLNSLLATSALLSLLLVPAFAQMAPLFKTIAQNPEILNRPDAVRAPQGAVLLINLLNFWNLAVTAHIYRHAANVNIGFGIVIALVASLVVLFMVAFAGSLAAALTGLGK